MQIKPEAASTDYFVRSVDPFFHQSRQISKSYLTKLQITSEHLFRINFTCLLTWFIQLNLTDANCTDGEQTFFL